MIEKYIVEWLNNLKPKICAFSYIINNVPVVCQMGYVFFEKSIILHTNTWTNKWKFIEDGQIVALCMGTDFLSSYVQMKGSIMRIPFSNKEFFHLEKVYLGNHPDSKVYSKKNKTGIFKIQIEKIQFAKIVNKNVEFKEWELT